MLIRKTAGFFLAALLLAASVLGIVAAFPSRTAAADAPATLTTENADLFLPTSYEQYLALKNPVDVAVCDDYIAVADENRIYVFSRESGEYSVYTHGNLASVKINKIQFSDSGELYFVNSAMQFFKLNLDNMSIGDTPLYSLSNFFISGNLIYAAATSTNTTQLRELALDGSSRVEYVEPFISDLVATPCITYLDGVLYYTVGNAAYKYDFATKPSTFILDPSGDGSTQNNISSICAYGDCLYYTKPNGLFVSDKNGNSTPLIQGSNCCAVTVYGGMLYCVKEKSVVQYDIEAGKFTDYEIASASSSENRLAEATESVRAGDLLVTADTGNDRISVYDFAEKRFVTLECAGVDDVATDGEIIAAATDTGICIFEKVFNPEILAREFSLTETVKVANVAGVACVYDAVYYVTGDFHYGKIARGNDGWNVHDVQRSVGQITPKAITADLFGDIYVADNDGKVYELDEENFATDGGLGNPVATIDEGFSSLRAGFDGTLYYLDGDKNLCTFDEATRTVATIDGADFVYTDGEERQPVSFALGYEDDEVYFCFGDFIVKSKTGALGLATLETLSETVLKGAEATLSAVADADGVQLADCNQNAVCVHGNVGALLTESGYCNKGGDGKSYKRYTEARRGVVLDRQSEYSLVAIYENHVYTAEIFRNEDLGEPFAPEKQDGEGATMYISSNCPAYHFPCIADLPAREASPLPRGTKVNVLCYVNVGGAEEALGGYPFAYVEYETAARSTFQCYVPAAYLTAVDPLGETEETYTLGYVKPGTTFTGSDGHKTVTEERVQARLTRNEDGTYTAAYEKDGVVYTATVEEGQIDWGESDALRIALIVILSVLAFVIIGAYVFLLPWNKKQIK